MSTPKRRTKAKRITEREALELYEMLDEQNAEVMVTGIRVRRRMRVG